MPGSDAGDAAFVGEGHELRGAQLGRETKNSTCSAGRGKQLGLSFFGGPQPAGVVFCLVFLQAFRSPVRFAAPKVQSCMLFDLG